MCFCTFTCGVFTLLWLVEVPYLMGYYTPIFYFMLSEGNYGNKAQLPPQAWLTLKETVHLNPTAGGLAVEKVLPWVGLV